MRVGGRKKGTPNKRRVGTPPDTVLKTWSRTQLEDMVERCNKLLSKRRLQGASEAEVEGVYTRLIKLIPSVTRIQLTFQDPNSNPFTDERYGVKPLIHSLTLKELYFADYGNPTLSAQVRWLIKPLTVRGEFPYKPWVEYLKARQEALSQISFGNRVPASERNARPGYLNPNPGVEDEEMGG